MMHVPEKYRIKDHSLLGSNSSFGNNGAFLIHCNERRDLYIIASDATDWDIAWSEIKWEHVSIHVFDGKRNLTPRWNEMCRVKDLFWDEEDIVIQYHPRRSQYINVHPNTLHLWRPINIILPEPPTITIS